ncbi:MAG: ATP synthase subunit I [Burkholderiales bacterium]|nr:ATP synthase subunit I [Burkholderiales bacterium]
MPPEYRRLVGLQGAITIVGAIAAFFAVSYLAAKSFAFGGSIVLVSVFFLAWRFQRGSRNKHASAEWHLRQAYRAAFERFAWTAVMLVVGFTLLKLEPLWVLVGFLGAQAVWLAAPIWMRVDKVK